MEQPIEFLIRAGQADTVDQLRDKTPCTDCRCPFAGSSGGSGTLRCGLPM